ncbi:unnamed protein product [Caenorhabditis bovis]|uniref:Glycosyl hydrolase family 38 C-terminal domain-containing protein n=1 Tax=Caenorhabditis bovis TaxID=2654633 RepID=A0A8S1F606_9PELO|nr:unnamed protein product [Caenorhabditis bovis]
MLRRRRSLLLLIVCLCHFSNAAPLEQMSRIVFASDVEPNSTLTLDFARNTVTFQSQIFSLIDASNVFSENGEKLPVYGESVLRFTLINKNSEKSPSNEPAIIYFVPLSDNHVATVYDLTTSMRIRVDSNNIANRFITLLSPKGAVKLSHFDDINGYTQLVISAGGVEEAQNRNYTIYNLEEAESRTTVPMLIAEPVVTLRKLLAVTKSDFAVTAQPYKIESTTITIPMNWSDFTVALSPNYRVRAESRSIRYIFNAALDNSQFDVFLTAHLDDMSNLTIIHDGYAGMGIET